MGFAEKQNVPSTCQPCSNKKKRPVRLVPGPIKDYGDGHGDVQSWVCPEPECGWDPKEQQKGRATEAAPEN